MLTIVAATAIMFFVNWELALVATAVTPLIVVIAYRYSSVSHPVLRDVQQKMADVATVAEENIVGVHVVKSFAQEETELEKFADRSERVFARSIDANKQRAVYVPLLSFLPLIMQAGVLLVGGRMVANGTLDIGTFFFFNVLVRDARDAAADARHVDRPVAARDRVGRADLRGHGRARGDRRRCPARRTCPTETAASATSTSRSSTRRAGRCCRTSTSSSSPGRPSR